jgi:hypothetical protein
MRDEPVCGILSASKIEICKEQFLLLHTPMQDRRTESTFALVAGNEVG